MKRSSGYTVSLLSPPRRISNRDVINELRLMQQQMRGLEARMSKIEHKQQALALRFIACAMSVTDDRLVIEKGVRRAG